MKIAPILLSIVATASSARAAFISDFEDVSLGASGYYDGADGAGGFASRGVYYSNNYNQSWGAWSGFAASRHADTTSPSYLNQYSAITGIGAGGSAQYGVVFGGASLTLPAGRGPLSLRVTNTTYAYLSMRDGDAFSEKFGGVAGDKPDFLRLTVTGRDAGSDVVGSVEFYLADYRSADNALDYLVDEWETLDLSGLAGARSLDFALDGSSVFTPAYFALDDLATVPEPAAAALLLLPLAMTRRRRVARA